MQPRGDIEQGSLDGVEEDVWEGGGRVVLDGVKKMMKSLTRSVVCGLWCGYLSDGLVVRDGKREVLELAALV